MHPRLRRQVLSLLAACALPAAAQTATAEGAPSERAQRDADKVRQMILLHADKPRKARADERPAAAPASPVMALRPVSGVDVPAAPPATVAALSAGPLVPAAPRAVPELASTPALAAAPVPSLLPAPPVAARPSKLELVHGAEPTFPRRLVQSGMSGSVKVAFDVLPDGSVTAVQILRSPHPGLNPAAVAAVSQWRFQPIAGRASGVTEFSFE